MRYLVFTNTPAHVHVYKHVVHQLLSQGHEVLILARDYQCTVELLEYYDLPHLVYGRCGSTKLSLFGNLPRQYLSIARHVRRYDPDLIFGMGSYAAHAGLISKTPTILLLDSEHHEIDHRIAHPFADVLLTPHAFKKDLGPNHYVFRGFKECAYLHPEVFDAQDVREELGIEQGQPYSFVRLNAFGSHHDLGESGFDERTRHELVSRLAEHGPVIVSAERPEVLPDNDDIQQFDLHPARLHDVLGHAQVVVTDTGTVGTEAALLGTPTVRASLVTDHGDLGNFVELEQQNLMENYRSLPELIDRSVALAADERAPERWKQRRNNYVSELVNLSELIVSIAVSDKDIGSISGVSKWTSPPEQPQSERMSSSD